MNEFSWRLFTRWPISSRTTNCAAPGWRIHPKIASFSSMLSAGDWIANFNNIALLPAFTMHANLGFFGLEPMETSPMFLCLFEIPPDNPGRYKPV